MAPAIFIQFVGEEGVYVIVAQEMAASRDLLHPTLFGMTYPRPGLFAWLAMPVAALLGWSHILIATRIVAIAATLLTGLTLAWLVRRIFKNDHFAAFAAVVYLSGDMLIYHGWLAYADPLFGLLTFAASALLWVAVEERKFVFFALGAAALFAAFLAKTPACYVFHGCMAIALLLFHPRRWVLFHPASIAAHGAALAAFFAWDVGVSGGLIWNTFVGHAAWMFAGKDTGNAQGFGPHLLHAAGYPFEVMWNLMPASGVAIYCFVRRAAGRALFDDVRIRIAATALFVSIVPYWLAADGGMRYLIPVFPLFALVLAWIVWESGAIFRALMIRLQWATIAVAFIASIAGFHVYEHFVRGSYRAAASAILERAQGAPIYALDDSSLGLSIIANLNILRARQSPPLPPLRSAVLETSSGYVVAGQPDSIAATAVIPVRVGMATSYLLCRGPVCEGR